MNVLALIQPRIISTIVTAYKLLFSAGSPGLYLPKFLLKTLKVGSVAVLLEFRFLLRGILNSFRQFFPVELLKHC